MSLNRFVLTLFFPFEDCFLLRFPLDNLLCIRRLRGLLRLIFFSEMTFVLFGFFLCLVEDADELFPIFN